MLLSKVKYFRNSLVTFFIWPVYVSSKSLFKVCQNSGDNSIAVTQWSAGLIKAQSLPLFLWENFQWRGLSIVTFSSTFMLVRDMQRGRGCRGGDTLTLHDLHHCCRKHQEVRGMHTGLFCFENMVLIEWEIHFKKTLVWIQGFCKVSYICRTYLMSVFKHQKQETT